MGDETIDIPHADDIQLMSALGRFDDVVRLIDESPLEAWFGIAPDRLQAILDAVPPECATTSIATHAFRMLLNGGDTPGAASPRLSILAARTFDARLRGQPIRAAQLSSQLNVAELPRTLVDSTAGWHAFLAVQSGITQMLGGEFSEALTSFASGSRTTPPATLSVLLRDAYTKSALIHALFGDPRIARNLLHAADDVPRTTSWAELVVSAHAEIAASLVSGDAPLDAIDRVERLRTDIVGEMWPFWIDALVRLYASADRAEDGVARALDVARLTPAGQTTEGYAGCVLPITHAAAALRDGDTARARKYIVTAVPDQISTILCRAFLTIADGRPADAIGPLVTLAARTRPLVQLESTRTVILAWAQIRLGQPEDAAESLRRLGPSRVAHSVLAMPADLDDFARTTLGWSPHHHALPSAATTASPALTPRERDVLALLATGRSRAQIAEKLFISTNTVKTQISSLYRKLGATNRIDALLAADRLGLF